MHSYSHPAWDINHRVMSRLKIRHLALLLHIQKLGSLTRVADAMSTSQPSVTQALADMEDMFGVSLFDRSSKGMTPTAQGLLVLERARSLLNDLELLSHDMHAQSLGRQAHLHVGIIPFLSGQLIAQATQQARPENQALTISLKEGTSEELLEQLRDHSLDCVVARALPKMNAQGLRHRVLYHQQPRLIAGRNLAARLGRRKLDWKMLQGLDWILGPRHTPIHRQVTNLFLSVGLTPPDVVIETSSPRLIGALIHANERAVSLVPAETAEDLVRISSVSIVPYSFEWTLPPVALFTRDKGPERDVDRLFTSALLALCRPQTHQTQKTNSFFY